MKILNIRMTKKYKYPLLTNAFNSKDINEGIKVLKTRFITMSKITEKFESLSDEQREIENELKNNKLGEKWGKGLEAGLIKYDPMVYERERGEDENFNNMFDDIGDNEAYVMDDMNEVNDISHMDDDDGMTSYDEY